MATQFLKSGDDGASASMSSAVTEPDLNQLPPEERGPAGAFLAAHPPGAGAPIAVVIPAYNEEPTVASVIREIPASSPVCRPR